jgi:hypothetical protein
MVRVNTLAYFASSLVTKIKKKVWKQSYLSGRYASPTRLGTLETFLNY